MLGVLLASVGAFFEEISSSISKREMKLHAESPYTVGFLNILWGLGFLIVLWMAGQPFVFRAAALPTFALRAALEMLQGYVTLRALQVADRSTFSFMRVGTIPLLLIADVWLGYALGQWQIAGIGLILLAFIILWEDRAIGKKGLGLAALTAVNAVGTISLYKYDISHFNSVLGEQIPMLALLLVFYFVSAHWLARENPLGFLRRRIFLAQSASHGVGGILESFAYAFAPASVALAAKRSSAILWATLAGNAYFRERHLGLKLGLFLLLAAGLVLLAA